MHAQEIDCFLYLGPAANLATDCKERQMQEIVGGHRVGSIVADREFVAMISFSFGIMEFRWRLRSAMFGQDTGA
jgi:hypothetical protein